MNKIHTTTVVSSNVSVVGIGKAKLESRQQVELINPLPTNSLSKA